jgi:hypothetical protein
MQIFLRIPISFLALAAFSWASLRGQEPSSTDVSIITPSEGSVVRPGEALHIRVSIASGVKVDGLCILSEMGYGENLGKNMTDEFTLRIPTDDPHINGFLIGPQRISAFGAIAGHEARTLAETTIDVERADLPLRLSAGAFSNGTTDTSEIVFSSEGDVAQIEIQGVFADGKVLTLRDSSYLRFDSSNPSVATVDEQGSVVAVSPGSASILASYTSESGAVRTTIPVRLPNLALKISPNMLNFGMHRVGTTSIPERLTLTNKTNSALTIFKPEIEGDFEESDDCLSTPLASNGGTCTITLKFAPREPGPKSGRLVIKNKLDEAPWVVPLYGTSMSPF